MKFALLLAMALHSVALFSNPSSKMTDPFVGTFSMSLNGQTAGKVIISQLGNGQYKVDSGNGYDVATKNGNILEGNSQGVPFQISISGNNLVMDLLGARFDLTRIESASNSGAQAPATPQPSSKANDPFVGTFTVSSNGQNAGSITIRKIGDNTYSLDAGTGQDNATRKGNVLEGVSQGVSFRVVTVGDNLAMELLNAKLDLIRTSSGQTQNTVQANGKIDPRLIGIWRSSTSHYSGSYGGGGGGSTSSTVIAFLENGVIESQSSFAAGGDGWSAGNNSDPVQRGTYSISNMTSNGGTVVINGQAATYELHTFSGEQKMVLNNSLWVKIR